MQANDCIIVINAGSSSIKFSMYTGPALALGLRGKIENLYSGVARLWRRMRRARWSASAAGRMRRSIMKAACASWSISRRRIWMGTGGGGRPPHRAWRRGAQRAAAAGCGAGR
jgi:hypothetical protein